MTEEKSKTIKIEELVLDALKDVQSYRLTTNEKLAEFVADEIKRRTGVTSLPNPSAQNIGPYSSKGPYETTGPHKKD